MEQWSNGVGAVGILDGETMEYLHKLLFNHASQPNAKLLITSNADLQTRTNAPAPLAQRCAQENARRRTAKLAQ
jgi:hypothetical protein